MGYVEKQSVLRRGERILVKKVLISSEMLAFTIGDTAFGQVIG